MLLSCSKMTRNPLKIRTRLRQVRIIQLIQEIRKQQISTTSIIKNTIKAPIKIMISTAIRTTIRITTKTMNKLTNKKIMNKDIIMEMGIK